MNIKLTSSDGAELILSANNPIEFALDLARQVGENDLLEIHEELWEAAQGIIVLRFFKEYEHFNPMNPDENFKLELI